MKAEKEFVHMDQQTEFCIRKIAMDIKTTNTICILIILSFWNNLFPHQK